MRRRFTLALAASALFAASPALFAQSGGLSKQDQGYFDEMAQANLAEIQMGKMAQDKAQSNEVKQFGQHMVDDHTKLLDQQKEMAQAKGIDMPQQPSKKDQATLKKLDQLSGAKFDEAYMKDMVSDHRKDVKKVQQISKKAKDPDLKAMAEKAVPELQQHLSQARSTEKVARSETQGSRSSAGSSAPSKSTQ